MKANPDDFVLLFPNEWGADVAPFISATHAEFWQEELRLDLGTGGGSIDLPEATVDLVIDPAIPELVAHTGAALEPFGASGIALLERHTQIYRVIGSGKVTAWALLRLASTFIEAGASAAFLPATLQIHSPLAIRHLAMEPSPDAMANFFVAAFDGDGWMRTRGLTPFGLPEIETEVVDGMNAAYFRLMDVSASMIATGQAFENESTLSLGPHTHRIVAGPTGPLRDEILVNGLHGVQTLR